MRVAIVTGAGSGIGKSAALALLKDGYNVGRSILVGPHFGVLAWDWWSPLFIRLEAGDFVRVLLNGERNWKFSHFSLAPPAKAAVEAADVTITTAAVESKKRELRE